MARFTNDQNTLSMLLDSGTYTAGSGTPLSPGGLVQSHTITQSQNVIQTRALGVGNKNVTTFEDGPQDFEGTMTFFPHDWRLLGFALGSISTTSGTAQSNNYRHSLSEQNSDVRHNAFTSGTFNPWISFTLEDARDGPVTNRNFVRTFKGCVVDSYSITASQGEPVSVEVGFMAQTGSFNSGAVAAITLGSNRPYIWSDAFVSMNATNLIPVKSATFTISNNFESPHYVNGSRVAEVSFPGNRDYTMEITQDLDSTTAGSLYRQFFSTGSKFNSVFDINNTNDVGSHHLILTMSGCKMLEMDTPVDIGGISEMTYTFAPGSVSALAHDRSQLYGLF